MSESAYRAPDSIEIGAVGLVVRDLDNALDFYHGLLGMNLLDEQDDLAALGFEKTRPLLILKGDPRAIDPPPRAAGLYHFALLTPDRVDLAYALRSLLEADYPMQGSADHFVSEAIYLADPEGNGIEIYADRPRDRWVWDGQQIRMGTVPLNGQALLKLVEGVSMHAPVLANGTAIGHIHLKVSHLRRAMGFYDKVLGFDLMALYGSSAAFYAAGGYHHHIGLNTWESSNGPESQPGIRGLQAFELLLPGEDALEQLRRSLSRQGQAYQDGARLSLTDPAGNRLIFGIKPGQSGLDPWVEYGV